MEKESAASIIMYLTKRYLNEKLEKKIIEDPQITYVEFTRAEIDAYLDTKKKFTSGMKTGALNRFLIDEGPLNNVRKVGWGKYVYSLNQSLQNTFEEIKKRVLNELDEVLEEIYNFDMPRNIDENDLAIFSKISKLIEIKHEIEKL